MSLITEISRPGRRCSAPPRLSVEKTEKPSRNYRRRSALKLPEVAEVDFTRHYMALSKKAFGVDDGFYPLGSCTMKYNPKLNEKMAALPGFTGVHPLQPVQTAQGCLALMANLQELLCRITGMDDMTLQPSAGAHGEWTGLQLIRAYHAARQDDARTNVLVPDSAHGTNPASAAMCGYHIVKVPSNAQGLVDIDALRTLADEHTAALMLTNPNTLGLFDTNIEQIAQIVHAAGGLLYYDGANLNAVMGISRPGDMGFDVMHLNLHKTFATPHGGGGPGSGPVGCKKELAAFLPVPRVIRQNDQYTLSGEFQNSIGKVRTFYGNFLVCVKAFTYILTLGAEGLKEASQDAVLNANYLLAALKEFSDVTYHDPCLHEFVLGLESIKKETGFTALDIAKALIDEGIHPPTMYFPLIVHEALMFEPTETESKETLDAVIDIMKNVLKRAQEKDESLHAAPTTTPIGRPDEVRAARTPVLKAEAW